jgi:hypothetical protein
LEFLVLAGAACAAAITSWIEVLPLSIVAQSLLLVIMFVPSPEFVDAKS